VETGYCRDIVIILNREGFGKNLMIMQCGTVKKRPEAAFFGNMAEGQMLSL